MMMTRLKGVEEGEMKEEERRGDKSGLIGWMLVTVWVIDD